MLIGIDAHNLEGQRTGVGRYVWNLLREWSKLNPKSQVPNHKFILYFKDEVPADLSLQLHSGQALFEHKLLKVSSTAKFTHWDLPRAAAKDKVEILFCPGYVAPLCYQGKIALMLHDISYEARPKDFNWPSLADKILLKWISCHSAKKAAVIFAPSEFSRQEIIKHYGVPSEKVIVTLLAADPSLLEEPSGKEDLAVLREKYALKDKFIFYVGSIFSRRHLPEIITAFECLAQENSEYQLLIGGQDRTSGQLVNKSVEATNKKIGRQAILRIDFISDDELKLLYSACAFFIWLSDYEGFGLPLLEAMSSGASVITTDGSSLSEVAGQAGLLIKDNLDVKEIYRAMHMLTRDEVLREELIARGKEQAKKFSWSACAEKTLEALTGQQF